MSNDSFESFFKRATGHEPFPYQSRLALSPELPQLVDIPTGAGKTAAVVLAWLWRRRFAGEDVRRATPRRLVYCLPMRVLVEQTRDNVVNWLDNLGMLAGQAVRAEGQKAGKIVDYHPLEKHSSAQDDNRPVDNYAKEKGFEGNRIAVSILMGGEDTDEWDIYPERDAVIIGTQDMLLSRALNRGYGMSRYRWPVHFGLLNTDCLWVMDEVQLMGVGVETSAQLEGLRNRLGTNRNIQTIWMSATLTESQLDTVDNPKPPGSRSRHQFDATDLQRKELGQRYSAKKIMRKSSLILTEDIEIKEYAGSLAEHLIALHKPGTLTILIANQVRRAQEVYKALLKNGRRTSDTILVHSRFRSADRKARLNMLVGNKDLVLVSTQVLEAGVDISARSMISELAPWPSIVQRVGRCNRFGEYEDAVVEWIDIVPGKDDGAIALPYDGESFDRAREILTRLKDAGPAALRNEKFSPPEIVRPVIRRKDLLDLFDTTSDISGNDLDISRHIRDGDDKDVQVYWRDIPEEGPSLTLPPALRDELCSVLIGDITPYLKKFPGWMWNQLDAKWNRLGVKGRGPGVRPGLVLLLDSKNGGYSSDLGWIGVDGKKEAPVEVLSQVAATVHHQEAMNEDTTSRTGRWITLTDHLTNVQCEVMVICKIMGLDPASTDIFKTASHWHDVGKAHPAFQNMLLMGHPDEKALRKKSLWAKSEQTSSRGAYSIETSGGTTERPYFRHELASALAWLESGGKYSHERDMVAYLIASHHGKVRLSIRSLPEENEPLDGKLFARGVWDGDSLPSIPGYLPDGLTLDMSPMQLGEGSWTEKMVGLRDSQDIGPFRLAWMEALLRAADWRASAQEQEGRG